MALPVNIPSLIRGKIVEWERLEYKAGWNPEEIIHTICAFANDINNWGGGYIILGVEEKNGIPVLPPVGLHLESLDKIQGELISLCYQIHPSYLPMVEPYQIDGKAILVVWVPAGDVRPYSAPSTMGKVSRRQYYIRAGSRSIVAKGENLTRLMEQTAKIPFDDRINQQASIKDMDLALIREFLQETGSDLFDESVRMPFDDLCRQMHIARGATEFLRPVNTGLLFFSKNPHRFFNRAWIELAIHPDDSGRNFVTETFKGPLHHQIRKCLDYLKKEVLRNELVKISGQAESKSISNYPFDALEEVLCNAVYHKSYAEAAPIEVQVFTDKITVLSYPGPMPPISNEDLTQRRVITRGYRNRRIGDFLKELSLTEGKSTGFPIIRDAMKRNENPEPAFYTDADRTLFLATLFCHKHFVGTSPLGKKVSKLGATEVIEKWEAIKTKGVDIQSLAELLNEDITPINNTLRSYLVSKSVSKSGPKSVPKLVTKLIPLVDNLNTEKTRAELTVDLEAAFINKLKKNEQKYPVEKFRDSNRKYNE